MMEFLALVLSAIREWQWLIGAIIVIGTLAWWIKKDTFLLTDIIYRFPLIGKLARFSKDYSEANRGGWLNVETTLCHDYARHVSALPKSEFDKNSEYLRKAYDHGRKPIPIAVISFLALLIALEGLGFSYLLSSWMALESSQNERKLLTFAIVCVLAAILVWVTHAAGHQLYRTRLLRSCFQQFQAVRQTDEPPGRKKVFISQVVALKDDQSVDNDQPTHVQCANRIATTPSDHGSLSWVWIAGLLVVFIAVISTPTESESGKWDSRGFWICYALCFR